ncbi:hypothetical protein MAR_033691 [Mya arenaria]|uniref:PLAT domain-containing protein n=1 Tax=Mya arenaria TaxID=6604 RepID=A0ABY7GCT6_MYAAR|nr:hypothetical protein MAR_033691 [Mya arenaria]
MKEALFQVHRPHHLLIMIMNVFYIGELNCTIPESTDVQFVTLSGEELKEGVQIHHGRQILAEKECKDYYEGYYLDYDNYGEEISPPTRPLSTIVNCTGGVISDYTLDCDNETSDTPVTIPDECKTVPNGEVTDNGQSFQCNEDYVHADSLLYERYSCSCDRNIPALVCNGRQAKCKPTKCECQNGGTCIRDETCKCSRFTKGLQCETQKCRAPTDNGNDAFYQNGATYNVTHESCSNENIPSFKGQITCENGTDGEVYLYMYGSNWNSGKIILHGAFEAGDEDLTEGQFVNVGEISDIRLGVNARHSNFDGWKPESVHIEDDSRGYGENNT